MQTHTHTYMHAQTRTYLHALETNTKQANEWTIQSHERNFVAVLPLVSIKCGWALQMQPTELKTATNLRLHQGAEKMQSGETDRQYRLGTL